ncbi:MAG: hypothetical protein ACRYFK_18265 [Janthinobacterium lividum]
MSSEAPVGPAAQVPIPRAKMLSRVKRALPRLRKGLSPSVQRLHARLLAGELTWLQVYLALDLPPTSSRIPKR